MDRTMLVGPVPERFTRVTTCGSFWFAEELANYLQWGRTKCFYEKSDSGTGIVDVCDCFKLCVCLSLVEKNEDKRNGGRKRQTGAAVKSAALDMQVGNGND